MTKVCTHGRGKELALKMLDESLRRLQTDHLDLWQVHGVSFDNDPELAYAKGGVLEALDQAKKQGKVRFVGFATAGFEESELIEPVKALREEEGKFYERSSSSVPTECVTCRPRSRSFWRRVCRATPPASGRPGVGSHRCTPGRGAAIPGPPGGACPRRGLEYQGRAVGG
jgi:hypothetical protein